MRSEKQKQQQSIHQHMQQVFDCFSSCGGVKTNQLMVGEMVVKCFIDACQAYTLIMVFVIISAREYARLAR